MCMGGYIVEIACSFDCGNSWTKPNFWGLQKKFNTLYKLYKENKLANGYSRSNHHACKYYDSFYQWWHQTGTIMKYVTTSANDSVNLKITPQTMRMIYIQMILQFQLQWQLQIQQSRLTREIFKSDVMEFCTNGRK